MLGNMLLIGAQTPGSLHLSHWKTPTSLTAHLFYRFLPVIGGVGLQYKDTGPAPVDQPSSAGSKIRIHRLPVFFLST